MLLNLENFTSHCLKNPEILLVLLIGPLLIRTYCVYNHAITNRLKKRILMPIILICPVQIFKSTLLNEDTFGK